MACCLYIRFDTIRVRKMGKESPEDTSPAHMVWQRLQNCPIWQSMRSPADPSLCGEAGDDRGPFADGEEGWAVVFRAEIRNSGTPRAGNVSKSGFFIPARTNSRHGPSPLIRIPTVPPSPPGWHSECRFLSRGSSPKELPNV